MQWTKAREGQDAACRSCLSATGFSSKIARRRKREKKKKGEMKEQSFCVSGRGELKESIERLVIIFPSQD